MSNYISEELAVVATIDPQLGDNAAYTSDWVDMKLRKQVMFVLNVGATDTTVDFKVQGATSSVGAGAADITGKSVTQLSATDDNKQVVIVVDASELSSTQTHVACVCICGNGTLGAQISAVGLSTKDRYQPSSDNDLTSVAQIVT